MVVHVCYVVSAANNYVPTCVPYLEGCASISASGREGPSYIIFKLGMLPEAALLFWFWLHCGEWLREHGESNVLARTSMVITGCLGAVFLVLYTVYLGSDGDVYRFMRRIGVMVYFGGSYLAQLILLARMQRLERLGQIDLPAYIMRSQLFIALGLMLFGAISIPLINFAHDQDAMENITEWWFALLMVSNYFFTWRAWRIL